MEAGLLECEEEVSALLVEGYHFGPLPIAASEGLHRVRNRARALLSPPAVAEVPGHETPCKCAGCVICAPAFLSRAETAEAALAEARAKALPEDARGIIYSTLREVERESKYAGATDFSLQYATEKILAALQPVKP